MLADQAEAFGQVASVPTAYRTLEEITRGGTRTQKKLTAAINAARRYAWTQVAQRHGALPGVRVADKTLQGVTCIRIDATVTPAHSEKELAEGNFKGFGHYPLLAFCDNTGGEPLAWMLRKGSAGSNTAADHIAIVDASVAALPPAWRRNLMVTVDGAGFSHKLVEHLDKLASRRGYTLVYSCGWELDQREKAAIRLVPEQAWQIAVDHRGEVRERRAGDACPDAGCGHRGLLDRRSARHRADRAAARRPGRGPADGLARVDADLRPPRAPASRRQAQLVRARGRLPLPVVGHQPARHHQGLARAERLHRRGHRVHARVEDSIRTGKATGIGRFPSHDYTFNQAWLTAAMMAQILLAWLKLLALDGDLAKAEPKTLRYRVLHAAARLVRGGRRRRWKIAANWPWAEAIMRAWQRICALPDTS